MQVWYAANRQILVIRSHQSSFLSSSYICAGFTAEMDLKPLQQQILSSGKSDAEKAQLFLMKKGCLWIDPLPVADAAISCPFWDCGGNS